MGRVGYRRVLTSDADIWSRASTYLWDASLTKEVWRSAGRRMEWNAKMQCLCLWFSGHDWKIRAERGTGAIGKSTKTKLLVLGAWKCMHAMIAPRRSERISVRTRNLRGQNVEGRVYTAHPWLRLGFEKRHRCVGATIRVA